MKSIKNSDLQLVQENLDEIECLCVYIWKSMGPANVDKIKERLSTIRTIMEIQSQLSAQDRMYR